MRREATLDILRGCIRDLQEGGEIPTGISPAKIDNQTPISELGLDSVGLISLVAAIEDVTGIWLVEDDLAKAKTLGDVTDLLERETAR